MPPLVRTVDVSKRYLSGETVIAAVSNVSLSIAVGEFVAIRGRSGSGMPAVQQQYGRNFGVSAIPYRPAPPVFNSPIGRR